MELCAGSMDSDDSDDSDDSKLHEGLPSNTDISFDLNGNAISNSSESLCRNCRQIPWQYLDRRFPPYRTWQDTRCQLNHCQSFGELDKSSQTGCHICQIIWLYIVFRRPDIKDNSRLKFTFNLLYGYEACILVHAEFHQQSIPIDVVKTVTANYLEVIRPQKSIKPAKRKTQFC